MKTGDSFFWGRKVGLWTWWPLFSGVEVKNAWSFISLPPVSLHHWLLIPSRNCTIVSLERGVNEFLDTALAFRLVYLQVALSDVWQSVCCLVNVSPDKTATVSRSLVVQNYVSLFVICNNKRKSGRQSVKEPIVHCITHQIGKLKHFIHLDTYWIISNDWFNNFLLLKFLSKSEW
jgi:hypothetical protein